MASSFAFMVDNKHLCGPFRNQGFVNFGSSQATSRLMKKIILSDHKMNLLVDDIVESLQAKHPFTGDHITGAQILEICGHKQVGQFILFRIYQDANQFVGQLGHPYFDFGSQEIKEDLKRLLASLSRNIQISKKDFQDLFWKAVYNNLKLILNPEDSLCNFFFGSSLSIPVELYGKHAPYFSDYDFVIRAILTWSEKQQLTRIDRTVFQEKFQRVIELYEQKEGKSIGDYQRGLFRSIAGKELDAVIGSMPPPVIRTETAVAQPLVLPQIEETPSIKLEPQTEILPPIQEQIQPKEEESKSVEVKKPLITILSKEREKENRVVDMPVIKTEETKQEEPSTNLPPWVDKVETAEPKSESKQIFDKNAAPPRTQTPPWVESAKEEPEVEPTIEIVTPKAEEPVTAPEPKAEPEPEKRTLGSLFELKDKSSLNERFSSPDERPSILDRNQSEQSNPVEEKPRSLLDKLKGQTEKPKEPISESIEGIERIEPPVVPPIEEKQPEVVKPVSEVPASKPLNFSEEGETKRLADRFKDQSQAGSLAESMASKSIKTEQIPVHKQFQYVQKVFGGSSVKFKVILDKINKTQSLAEAEEVLEKYVFNDPNVNRNDKVAKEFEDLVRARFD